MAIKATIYKAALQIADMDRHYYGDHSLTIVQHPSESVERMMVRLLAFALNASDTLQFTRGLCVDEEPELWQKNLHGDIELWIELGQPDERRLRKACALSEKVILYTYQPRSAAPWWQQQSGKLAQLNNLSVYHLPGDSASQLTRLTSRNMQLQCSIQEGEVWLSNGETALNVPLQRWQ